MKHHEDRLETFTLLVIHNTLKQVREPFGAWRGMAWLGSGWVGWVQPALAAPIMQHGLRAADNSTQPTEERGIWETEEALCAAGACPPPSPRRIPSLHRDHERRTRLRAELEERAAASEPRSGSSRLCRAGQLKNGWLGWERGACAGLLQNVAWSGRRLRVRPSACGTAAVLLAVLLSAL